ncbi:pentapeptide repeat-containing protein [Alicyclobacillus acidiphilus]|uniref:pentapeptide repeat-containing protein n=1 Tax=Alicyclobacillus acidiphilus TaxID=182455 RepID=UPI00082ADC23|nr:pentapeptide repeat-containing protein [Alicyclobacillus acidiphilus]
MNASAHRRSAFTNCQFRMANLFGAKFDGCKMTGSSFQEANLTGLTIVGGDWSYVNLRGHTLKRANFRDARLAYADLYGGNLEGTDFTRADLTKVILDQSKLRDVVACPHNARPIRAEQQTRQPVSDPAIPTSRSRRQRGRPYSGQESHVIHSALPQRSTAV